MGARNPQLIKRKGSHLYIHTQETVPVTDTDNIKALEQAGFHFLHVVAPDGSEVIRRSKKSDGYVRDLTAPWHKTAEIFPFEEDQVVWNALVAWWFNGARADEEYMEMLRAAYKGVDVDKMLRAAEEAMVRRRPKKKGGQGKRRGDVHNWLVNDRRSFAATFATAFYSKKGDRK